MHVVLTTCEEWPDLLAGDLPLVEELEPRGHTVAALPWTTTPITEFTSADLVVLRANWDFHHDLPAFEAWLAAVDQSDARLENPAELVLAHNHKTYLKRYADLGIPTPQTLFVGEFDVDAIGSWMDDHGFERTVSKPAWGASSHGVQLLERGSLAEAAVTWAGADDHRGLLVQEFQPGIAGGEYAMVFFWGTFSHALHRVPSTADFRINSQFGGKTILATDLGDDGVAFGATVVDALPQPAAYARIDVVRSDTGFTLMEVEINEPAIGLHLAPGSEARFADALGC